MKKMVVIGRIGKKEAKYTPQGKLIVTLSVAENKKVNGEQVTTWIKGQCWEKTGEIIQQYADVGDRIYIEGDFEIKAWIDREGNARPDIELTVRSFELLGERRADPAQPAAAPSRNNPSPFDGEDQIPY